MAISPLQRIRAGMSCQNTGSLKVLAVELAVRGNGTQAFRGDVNGVPEDTQTSGALRILQGLVAAEQWSHQLRQ